MKKPKKQKRQKLGEGYIWFNKHTAYLGYTHVCLANLKHGGGGLTEINIGKLGAWQKVKLYAEWTE